MDKLFVALAAGGTSLMLSNLSTGKKLKKKQKESSIIRDSDKYCLNAKKFLKN